MNDIRFNDMAQRICNAEENFIDLVCEMTGMSKSDALVVLCVYKKIKAIKLAVGIGRYEFTHGAYVDSDCMRRALSFG